MVEIETQKRVSFMSQECKTSLTHAGHGKKTKEWDGRGAHSYTDGMDSPPAQTQRENVLVSFALLKASVAEHSITNFNGDGGERSPTEKRRVEGQMR